jgi:basic amino acid/polyamine antiporter, APA family
VLILPSVAAAGAASSLIFLVTFALTHWVAILVRQRSVRRPPPFRVPLFPLAPVAGGLACIGLAVFQGVMVPLAGTITVIWLSVGGILFLALFARRARVIDVSSVAFDPELVTLRGRSPLVLVPIANPQNSPAMLALADALVPANVGRVLMHTVVVAPADWRPDVDPAPIERTQAVLRELLKASAGAGIRVEALTTVAPQPMEEIARVARLHRCDSVLMGLSELSQDAHGTQLEALVGALDANVVVLRSRENWRLADAKRILVPIRGRGGHQHLLAQLLGSILRDTEREVTFLRVLPTSVGQDELRRATRELAHLAHDYVRQRSEVKVLQSDDPLATIAQCANESDLLILGVQREGRQKKLFGNLTRQIAARSACPIIVLSRRG